MRRALSNVTAKVVGGDVESAAFCNRLADEASPYLRQHAGQPVHWRPWSADAFALAEREQKPVLVSIGYLACYWCHVMSQESFCDIGIADIMNRDFINIKVDREERPDVDRSILDAMARLGARTGWPVTAFLTPQGSVYDGGSYFPPVPRHGLAGFPDVLARAARRFSEGGLEADSADNSGYSAAASRAGPGAVNDIARYADYLAARLSENVDPLYGGFGLKGPKFPQPALHELLWRIHAADRNPLLAGAVEASLANICRSALFDQVGGGFHRYCVDEAWSEPHFEKMLYDNAQLIELMTWLWRGSKAELFAQAIEQTIEWVVREMLIDGGGFAASLGAYCAGAADSDHGVPGQFYLWSRDQLAESLGDTHDLFESCYEIRSFPDSSSGPLARTEKRFSADQRLQLTSCRAALLTRRATRARPARDHKVLADWNGLMIVALTEAGIAFERADWIALAETTFDTLAARLGCGDKLRHCITDDRPGPEGLLEDYASMARAALRLYEYFGHTRYLALARSWVAVLDRQFWDIERGGYFTSSDQDWRPGDRLRTITETSLPSGNGMMIGVLARLHEITGEGMFRDRAERLVQAFQADLTRYGIAVATALNNVLCLDRFVRVNVSGPDGDATAEALFRAAQACCLPDRMVLRQMVGKPAAQICIGTSCLLPVTDPIELARLLEPGGLATVGAVGVSKPWQSR